MITKNEEYTARITSLSSDGSGVCRIDGFTVFVPYTAEGDEARFIIETVKPRFATARLLEVTAPSSDRIAPDCEAFGKCGGCKLRHISYGAELSAKRGIIENAMQRIGGFKDFTLENITGADNTCRYRNKTIFRVSQNPISCGFYAQQSHDIIPVSDCAIGIEENRDILAAVTEYMQESGDNAIESVFTRKSFSNGEIMALLSLKRTLADTESMVRKLCAANNGIVSIITEKNKKKKTLYGKDYITDKLCGIEFAISPDSFFQINPVQTEKLYSKALEYAAITENDTVMDIYCGIGTISLCAAKSAKSVIGVEIVEKAIADAKMNAKRNKIQNAAFYASSADSIVPDIINSGERPDIVILDPPRSGSDKKTLNAIIKAAPKRIVYVSCNCATLARDAKFLAEYGYKIKKAHGFDLFPRTNHVECVVLMSKVQN